MPEDTREQVIRKTALMLLVFLYTLLSLFWGTVYLLLGLKLSAAIPYGYGMISVLTLLVLFSTKHYETFRFIQLFLILLIPFLAQWSLGGFSPSGAVMLWSVLSPMGALMFSGPRRAWAWFVGYLLLIMVSVVFDTVFTMSDHTVPALVSAAFFVFNIAGVTSIAFFLLRYFVRKGEETISELGEKHHQVTREKARLYKIKSMMANFVPEIPKKMIEENPEKELLGKYIQDATVLFLDIEGFASLTEKYPYETINQTIEHHFSLFFDLVKKQGGDINETAGDGMMVIFLDSVTGGHAGNAVRAALDILTCCPDRSEEMKKGFLPITVNIGINSGEVYLGSTKLRSSEMDRWTFTASGPVTVLAARLSNYAQGGRILIGGETARRVKEQYTLQPLEGVSLKNLADVGPLFEVV
ncbi:MAG: adenylate/guanylate cyclase domain-containing protein [Deltaproteobacteria bacterium]|nr:adenylate/guanylate cyclase domain-containing protein [Deltaproteobacteria bacterium]